MTASLNIPDLDAVSKTTAAGLAACFASIAGVTVGGAASTDAGSNGAQGSGGGSATAGSPGTTGGDAQGSGSNANASGSTTQPATGATVDPIAAITAKFFPTDPANAAFPSPENSRIIRNPDGTISGRPYLEDANGAVHRLVTPTAAGPNGYTVNGHPTQGGGSSSPYNLLLVRQGQVFAQLDSGQYQLFNPGMGSMYNSSLPAPFATDASGNTTSTAPTSNVTAPADPTPTTTPGGSSGKTLTVGAGQTYPTITAAFQAAQAGDTVAITDGTYKETPPAITVPLKVTFSDNALLDTTGLTTLARGKGAIVVAADCIIVNPHITGAGMTETVAGGTAAIRPDTGCGYFDVQGGKLYGNQNGVAGGDIACVARITNTVFDGNGLGDGYTHDIYMSNGTIRTEVTNITAVNPKGGHALKSRAFNTVVKGGSFAATDATAIDIPNGSVAVCTIDGATITKPAGSNNHGVVGYASENANSGLGGMLITNTVIDAECDNPFIQAGNGSTITLGAGVIMKGSKPTADGTVKGL